jgi:hypothetical protein
VSAGRARRRAAQPDRRGIAILAVALPLAIAKYRRG